MGRTLDAARHYADTPDITIEPRETAKGVFVRNQPGADALKVLIVLIDTAGANMADDMAHEIRLRDLNTRKGIRNHNRGQIRETLRDLAQAVMEVDDTNRKQIDIGSVVPHANVDYRDEASGDLTIRWKFGEVFRKLASSSAFYAKLDSAALLAMRSRYAIALLRHCSTHFEKTRTNREEFDIGYLRQVLGVPDGRINRFADLNRRALQPAIAEINVMSRWILEATPHKTGRTVTSVTISWTEKPLAQAAGRNRRADRGSATAPEIPGLRKCQVRRLGGKAPGGEPGQAAREGQGPQQDRRGFPRVVRQEDDPARSPEHGRHMAEVLRRGHALTTPGRIARASKEEQNLGLQHDALRAAGCERLDGHRPVRLPGTSVDFPGRALFPVFRANARIRTGATGIGS